MMSDGWLRDFRWAARALRRSPGFTFACALTLALGIGATSAIFTVVDAALLKPPPYPEPDRLLVVDVAGERMASAQTGQLYLFLRDRLRAVEHISAQRGGGGRNVVVGDASAHVRSLYVSEAYFAAHGVPLLLGRTFSSAEVEGTGNAAIIGEALWQRMYGARPEAIGQTIDIGEVPHVIVGIAPASFRSIPAAELWTPLRTSLRDNSGNYTIFGRVATGGSVAGAAAEFAAAREDILRTFPDTSETVVGSTTWVPLRHVLGAGVRQPLLLLLGAVGFLLLIACLNIASLNVTRALARRREMATRAAIGASRARLVRQAFAESTLLTVLGAGAGLALGLVLTRGLVGLVSEQMARQMLSGEVARVDARVLVFTMAIAAAAALFFGVVPALLSSRIDLRTAIAEAPTMTMSRGTIWMRQSLAIAEVTLACVLLVGAGLLARTLINLHQVDLGFNPQGISVIRMSLQGAVDPAQLEAFLSRGLDRLRELPGTRVAVSNGVPVERALNVPLPPPDGSRIADWRAVDLRYVTPGYFDVFDIESRAGRRFDEGDRLGARPVAIVNEAFARVYYGSVDVVGRNTAVGEIVGVVRNVKGRSGTNWTGGLTALGSASAPTIFLPAGQAAALQGGGARRTYDLTWAIRSDRDLAALEPQLIAALDSLDSRATIVAVEPMEAVIARDLDLPRFVTSVLGAFAVLGILLAAIGLYGLAAYAAAQRTREIGVRMAVGATAVRILRRFLAESLGVATAGLVLGLVGAVFLTSLLQTLLFGITPLDVSTFVVAAALLLAVMVVATAIPAARAARVDPVTALRTP